MLAGSCFGDDPLLAHPAREQNLANGIVDLVRSGMTEIFALEIDFRSAKFFRQPLRKIKRSFPSRIFMEVMLKFLTK